MAANEYQIGGSHYKGTGYEHWDLCVKLGLSYLEGSASKYVCRWRKKNGIEDLRKALHYHNKIIEVGQGPDRKLQFDQIAKEVARFSELNRLGDLERVYLAAICSWVSEKDLLEAREVLLLLFDEAEALMEQAKAVPVSDSNKHAERE